MAHFEPSAAQSDPSIDQDEPTIPTHTTTQKPNGLLETRRVYDLYCYASNKNQNQYKLSDKRKQKIRQRIRDAGLEMLESAIRNAARDPFYSGENDRGWVADLDYITRSYEITEKLAALNSNAPMREVLAL